MSLFIITHLNRIMHHIQRKKWVLVRKLEMEKCMASVKIWDEWVKDSGIDEEITLLNVQALSGADAKNRLKGTVRWLVVRRYHYRWESKWVWAV